MKRFSYITFQISFLITGTLLLINTGLLAQNDPVLRIEIETRSDEANYKLAPCGEFGAVMFYKTTVAEEDYKFWIFVLYNTLMQESWKQEIPIFDNMQYADHERVGDFLYLFYHDPEKRKSDEFNFQLLEVNLKEGTYELFSGLLPEVSVFVDFKILASRVIIGMNINKDYAGLYTFDMESRALVTQNEILNQQSRFESIYIDEEKKTAHAVFNVHASKNDYYLLVQKFDLTGQNLLSLKLTPEPGKKFNTGKVATVRGNFLLVFGTYGVVKGMMSDAKDYFLKESAGFYVANITNPDSATLRYQNFLDLENMTGYLKSKEYQMAKKKAEKKEGDDIDKYSVTYDMLLHDIIERDSLFYFVGEAFFEHYHTVTNTYYDYYGRAVPVSYSVFDGYRYFNAFISCYDEYGNKLWDNGMEIFNILTFDLKNRVSVYFTGEETVMAYNREGKISAKIINGPKTVEGVNHFPLETSYYNDKVMEDTKSNMVHWYDNYFLAYGFQTIRNNAIANKSKRTVFYMNKVAFE